eukprot:gene3480-13542_t
MLAELDNDKHGFITEEQWETVELWFQYRVFRPGVSKEELESIPYDENDPEIISQAEKAGKLKKILWEMFSSSSLPADSEAALAVAAAGDGLPRVAFCSVLLYMCADSITSNARLTPAEVAKVAYPLGPRAGAEANRCPYDLSSLTEMVRAIYLARGGDPEGLPTTTAEQLMYTSEGQKIMKNLLQLYLFRDTYVCTRL